MLLCVQTVLGPEATTANKTDHVPGLVELMFRPQRVNNQKMISGTSLAVQWLGLCAFTSEVAGSILAWGTKILQAVRCGQKKKKKKDDS